MFKFLLGATVAALVATSAYAQEALIPTDISDFGELSATIRLNFAAGKGTLAAPGVDIDLDIDQQNGQLEGSFGLGLGFEVELILPYVWKATTDGDFGGAPFDIEQVGFGDPIAALNYKLSPESATSPQVMAGLILIMPISHFEVAEVNGDTGSAGEGVFRAGALFGLSKKFGPTEGYLMVTSVFATGTAEDGDTEIDRPNRFDFILGAKFGLGSTTSLDVRLTAGQVGEQVIKDLAGDSTEEQHIQMSANARVYANLGGPVTLIIGGGATWVQDHTADEEANLDQEEVFVWGFELGLHIKLGLP